MESINLSFGFKCQKINDLFRLSCTFLFENGRCDHFLHKKTQESLENLVDLLAFEPQTQVYYTNR